MYHCFAVPTNSYFTPFTYITIFNSLHNICFEVLRSKITNTQAFKQFELFLETSMPLQIGNMTINHTHILHQRKQAPQKPRIPHPDIISDTAHFNPAVYVGK